MPPVPPMAMPVAETHAGQSVDRSWHWP